MIEKTVADFFAGIGLVQIGLERQGWSTVYSLDYSEEKKEMYSAHFGTHHYRVRNIHEISVDEIPTVLLAHASFPCTDISVAGSRSGLNGKESSAFWGFIRILDQLNSRRPPLVLIENVEGFLTSQKGKDLEVALEALGNLGYALDMMLINASHFVPQSRTRLFIIGIQNEESQNIFEQESLLLSSSSEVRSHKMRHFIRSHANIKWNLRPIPPLPKCNLTITDIIDATCEWWPRGRSEYLFNQMSNRHKEKIYEMMANKNWSYGTVFRRMRNVNGLKKSMAELRTDGIAGCLRTPKGGSARQIVIRAGQGRFDARLLSARECARLMGADEYCLPQDLPLNQALFGFGDAVCVPAIEWLAQHVLSPIASELDVEPKNQYVVPDLILSRQEPVSHF